MEILLSGINYIIEQKQINRSKVMQKYIYNAIYLLVKMAIQRNHSCTPMYNWNARAWLLKEFLCEWKLLSKLPHRAKGFTHSATSN